MNDAELLRYSRQIMLPEFGIEGQQRLRRARVLIVGAGGLGSPVALYLAAAGVGFLDLSDPDRVEASNLQRQIAHGEADLGQPKVRSAAAAVQRLNAACRIHTRARALDGTELQAAVAAADLVLDCSDNFPTRDAVNAACLNARRPLVSAAVIRAEGQLGVFDPRRPDSPCYRCLYPDGIDTETGCTATGVIAPMVGVLGSLQALEAVKLLSGVGQPLVGQLLLVDGWRGDFRRLRLPRDPACPACGKHRGG